jgi:hypothetical protein
VIPPASIHFDLQFELIDWDQLGVADGREQLSLTLAIALPAEGGGLMVWNINRTDIEATDEARRAHMCANRHASRHPYTPGHLAVHWATSCTRWPGARSAADRRAHHDAGARPAGRRTVGHLPVAARFSLKDSRISNVIGDDVSVTRVSAASRTARVVLPCADVAHGPENRRHLGGMADAG